MPSILETASSYGELVTLNGDEASRLEIVHAEMAALEESGALEAVDEIRRKLDENGRFTYTVLRVGMLQPVAFDPSRWSLADAVQLVPLTTEGDLPVVKYDMVYSKDQKPHNGFLASNIGQFDRSIRVQSDPLGVSFSHTTYIRPFPNALEIPHETWERNWEPIVDWTRKMRGNVGEQLTQFYKERINGVK